MRQQLGNTLIYPLFVAGGLVLWVMSLASVRMTGLMIETTGGSALFYGGGLALALIVAVGVRSISPPSRLVEAMAVFALSGLLADAALLKLCPFAYGEDERIVRHVMSWRVAVAGFLLLAGILFEHRPVARKKRK